MPKATGRKPHANPVWGYYHVGASSQCKATCQHCNQKVAPYAPKLGQHLMYECRSMAANDRADLRAALAEGQFEVPVAPSNDGTPPKKRQKPDTSGEQVIAFKAAGEPVSLPSGPWPSPHLVLTASLTCCFANTHVRLAYSRRQHVCLLFLPSGPRPPPHLSVKQCHNEDVAARKTRLTCVHRCSCGSSAGYLRPPSSCRPSSVASSRAKVL
jgi:hypothetical protein